MECRYGMAEEYREAPLRRTTVEPSSEAVIPNVLCSCVLAFGGTTSGR